MGQKSIVKAKKWPQVLAAMVAGLGTLGGGTTLAWTAPVLSYIQQDLCLHDCDVSEVTENNASWIVALGPMGAIPAGIVGTWLLGRVGRRWTLGLGSLPYLIGNLLFVISYEIDSKICIYVGRLLTGFSFGLFCLVGPIYVMEVAEPRLRGLMGSITMAGPSLGLALINALSIEDAVHWNWISAICIAIPG